MQLTDAQMAELRYRLEQTITKHPDVCTSAPNMIHTLRSNYAAELECAGDRMMMRAIDRTLVEHWWSMARSGIIALVGHEASGISSAWFTDYGLEILKHSEPSPHDESRFLQSIRERVKRPDPVAIEYIAEAAAAWRARLYRSSVVMLGCACERLILLLAGAISQKTYVPYSEQLQKALAASTPIATIFDKTKKALEDHGLPRALEDGLDRRLVPIFERTRMLRNRSGHPSGDPVSVSEAHAGLLLVADFFGYVDALVAHVDVDWT